MRSHTPAHRFTERSPQAKVEGPNFVTVPTGISNGAFVSWRVCFRWSGTDAHDVEIVDYH